MFGCERCKSEMDYGEEMTLMGVYHARLCRKCRMEWDELILPHPLYKKSVVLSARRDSVNAATMRTGDRDSCQAEQEILIDEQIQLSIEMFNLAKQWVAGGVP